MDRPTSIPQHIWDSFSDEARALVATVIDGLERQIIELRQQVQDLKARVDQNSTNSSKPPSTDPIGVKRKPPEPPSKTRRGGQKGHPRRMRALVPPDRVALVTDCKPIQCQIWRRISGGTDSEEGSRFVERVLSVVATCRQQKRSVLEYLTRCHQARLNGKAAPPLLSATSAALASRMALERPRLLQRRATPQRTRAIPKGSHPGRHPRRSPW